MRSGPFRLAGGLPTLRYLPLSEGLFNGGYLRWDSTTQATFMPDEMSGDAIHVNGEDVRIPFAGMSRALTGTGNTKINAQGNDSGSLPATNDMLYAYVSNSRTPFSPLSLRYSTTAPVKSSVTTRYGYGFLGAGAIAQNWRHVGQLFFDSAAQVKRTDYINHLASFMNPKRHLALAVPNYSDDNADTTYAPGAAAGYGALNGSTDYHEFLYHPAYGSKAFYAVQLSANGSEFRFGIEKDDEGGVRKGGVLPISASVSRGTVEHGDAGTTDLYTAGGALRKYQMMYKHATTSPTFIADLIRNGSLTDPPATYLLTEYWR